MFTGLVQTCSKVSAITHNDDAGIDLQLTLEPGTLPDCRLGDSIAVNGTCLTIVALDERSQNFQVGPETVRRTNLGSLDVGDSVNIETSLRVGQAMGGHFVTGHIDTTSTILRRERQGEWEYVEFDIPTEFLDLVVPKGSIAIDGISLTISKVNEQSIEVMLIPHTMDVTTLGQRAVGDFVNLEFDLLAKHVKRILQYPTKV